MAATARTAAVYRILSLEEVGNCFAEITYEARICPRTKPGESRAHGACFRERCYAVNLYDYSFGNFLARSSRARSRVWRFFQKSAHRSPTLAMRSSKLRSVNCSAEILVVSSSGVSGVETVAFGNARTE